MPTRPQASNFTASRLAKTSQAFHRRRKHRDLPQARWAMGVHRDKFGFIVCLKTKQVSLLHQAPEFRGRTSPKAATENVRQAKDRLT